MSKLMILGVCAILYLGVSIDLEPMSILNHSRAARFHMMM